jgi:hypothetical protein
MGLIINLIAAFILSMVLGWVLGTITPVTLCVFGVNIQGYAFYIALIMVFAGGLWATISRILSKTGEHAKGAYEKISGFFNPTLAIGLVLIIIAILRVSKTAIFRAGRCSYCVPCLIIEFIVGIGLFVLGIYLHTKRSKRGAEEDVTDFGSIEKKRGRQIALIEEQIARRIEGYKDLRSLMQFTAVTEALAKKEAAGGGANIAALEKQQEHLKELLAKELVDRKKIIGEIFAESRKKLKDEGIELNEIKEIQAKMAVGALNKKIIAELAKKNKDVRKFRKKIGGIDYEHREYWH